MYVATSKPKPKNQSITPTKCNPRSNLFIPGGTILQA